MITYEAGSLAKADTSLPPDIYYGVPTDSPAFGQIDLEGIPAEVWTYALAKLKLTVTDVVSGTACVDGPCLRENSLSEECLEESENQG